MLIYDGALSRTAAAEQLVLVEDEMEYLSAYEDDNAGVLKREIFELWSQQHIEANKQVRHHLLKNDSL